MNTGHIYRFTTPDGKELMHSFNYPPSEEQLNEYLHSIGWQFAPEDNLHVGKEHLEFIDNITRRFGVAEADKYGKVAVC